MKTLRLLVLPIALLCGSAAHAQDAGSMTDPATLFGAACASGQARLPRSTFDDIAYGAMPVGARRAFALSLTKAGAKPAAAPVPLGDLEVPNRVLTKFTGRDLFLLLPAAGLPGASADVCSVAWQGAHLDDAVTLVQNFTGTKAPLAPGATYYAGTSDSHLVAAAQFDQWTVISIVPTTPSKEQKTP
ncbi:hypothetical protein AB2M62_19435 [Sphingomonas sp. MMS12-HWE2-04]|uniref:hypothetical protein n=1 Tax=Sphingomonas sp. MMS12-HWE2-04 TaxID=3234199 RepID=UPI00384E8744